MRRPLVILLGAGLASGLVALVLLSQGDRRVIFPNGSQIEFLGTTVGRQPFTTEKRWHKLAKRWLPSRLGNWFPSVSSATCTSGANDVTVFIRLTDPTGGFTRGQRPWGHYAAEDDSGFRYNPGSGYCSSGGGAGTQVIGLSLTTYPRRQPSFALRFLDTNHAVLGTLRVPNPVRGPFPKWQPRGLPQSQTNGPVTLTLESIEEAGNENWRSVSPKWKITSTNPGWARAKPKRLTLYDATGNEGSWLSPREPAWKARTVVHRNDAKDFDADERLWIPDVAVPTKGTFVAIDKVAELAGVNIKVHLLAGAGRLFRTNGTSFAMIPPAPGENGDGSSHYSNSHWVEYWGSETPFLLVEVLNIQPDDEVRFRLIDDRGREMKLTHLPGFSGSNNKGRIYKRVFNPRQGAKLISLEVIVSRPLYFEFMLDPKHVRPGKLKTMPP